MSVPAQGRDGEYWLVSGTSPACALVAGVAALIKSKYPHLPPDLVASALTSTTTDRPAGGYNSQVGFGIVNAAAALTRAPAPVNPVHAGDWTGEGIGLGFASALLAVGVAALGIWSRPVRGRLPASRLAQPPLGVLRKLHSGHIGDYVAWLMLGLAVLAGFIGLPAR